MKNINYNFDDKCQICDKVLIPYTFIDKEYVKNIPTGRIRYAVSHLYCPMCGKKVCVDDSLDGIWFYPN